MLRFISPLIRPLAVVATFAVLLTGCSTKGGATSTSNSEVDAKVDAALKKLEGTVLSKGPHDEEPATADTAELSDDEIAEVKALGATAAIVMHYGGNDWSNAQVDGLRAEFERLGIEVVAVTDANFKPDKQVSDIETVLSKEPDIIVSIPTDPVATASAYKKAADAGVKLVFMDNSPQGLKAGEDYVSVVSADNHGNGVVSAHLMAKALGGAGKIGVIHHEADFFVTTQRHDGFTSTIKAEYPDIEIVAEQGIAGPDFAGDAQAAANAMLNRHPDLAGIWAVWDVPAEGVMAAARASGRKDLKIATQDLGKNVGIGLAKNELIVGLGAQRPYDQGVTEARLAAGALIGKEAAPYVALPALPVQHANVLEAWKQVYQKDAPEDLAGAFEQ
ncbi:sugar ABC transporter substrate-binding protein [Arachnia propionica]|uniref:Sugar ABC transporter substrate-binding protein n=1 Tax=Arachnia propionica TaxID=1750 RepID=A0A3P1T569_9ACTN|nr:substrate-binding domain-containing protein [Arachnia propionica]RRD04315.1 sugar ABC transporter substrate-binding protein [Arachnia propionica]